MKGFYFFFVHAFVFVLIFPFFGLAEGTKQLMPDSASNKTCKILIANGNVSGQRDPFALYNGDTNYRLFIHISDFSKEKIYFGLGASSGSSVNWRIHRPDGTVLWSGTTPIASSPSGFIKYYKQAYVGPTKIDPQGYPAKVVTPGVNGDYFMTFQVSNGDSRMFEMFDITVIDTTTNMAKNGRVFSKAWQLSTYEPNDHGFFGKLFPYTNDGIVSKFDPNGFLGRWFTVSCNESGCYKIDGTHNAQQARRSTNGWHNYPQYKIFLNDPDTIVYPSGEIGQMIPDSLQVISNCNNGTIEFIILTTAKGNIEITLELGALGPPYVNRILIESTNGGKDTIIWDGKDGNGVSVNNGSSFLFTLRFYNGLTHLPLWDVENNPNGFKVTLVRPQTVPVIPDPEFFWDDSEIGGGTLINPPGCTSTLTTGCHSWTGDWGDNRTINTWWFVVSTTTTPVYITYKKGPSNLGVITGPSQVCQGETGQYSVANDPNSTQYDWTWPGGSGTTYTPTIIITIPSNATPGPGQIKVNGVNSVCGAGPVSTKTITINQIPTITNSPKSKSICQNTSVNLPLTANVTGTTFQWSPTCGNPAIGGYSNGSGNVINDVLTNTGIIPGIVEYVITPFAAGCQGDTIHYLVTVNPKPDVTNNPPSKSICSNTGTNLTLTSNVTGTLFTWTVTGSSLLVSGYSNSTTPTTTINQTLINSGYNIETVTYHITPHANGCDGQLTVYVVTVYPTPDLSNDPLFMQVCNSTPTNQTLLSNVAGTLFTWTATASSPLVTGYSDNATPTAFLNQTLVNAGLNVEYVTYRITPHANGCIGTVTDYVVTVVSSPDVYFSPPAQIICSQQTSSIQVLSHVPGTTFAWTATGSSLLVTGYSDGAGSMIQQTVQNSGTTIEAVTYTVTPTAWGCPPGTPQIFVLTVNPKPAITNMVTIFQQCSAATTNINQQSSVPGSSFTWIATGSSPQVTGFSAGTGNQIQQTLVNTGYNIETVIYNVTPIANNCPGDPTSFTVTVFPVPDVFFTPPSQALCPSQTSNITNNSHVSGASFIWTATGSSLLVSGYSGGSGNLIRQTLNNTGYNIETVTYHVAPTANGCPGINNNVVVSVDPAPVVSFTLCIDPVTTTDAQPIKLKGGNPFNGTYSGRGVSGTTLYPALAGVGTDTIFYSFTNTYGCSRNNYIVLSVIAPLPFTCNNTLTDPRDNKQYPTVQIGIQCWMASNLDYGIRVPGTEHQRDNCITEKYCYNDNPGNCTTSGGLYQWDELMKYDNSLASQGFCPPGWHVPSEANWNTLFNFYISNGFAGSPLKYTGYSGYNALLDGAMFKNASWNFNNFATLFWSSSSQGPYKAWAHGMNEQNPSVSYYPSARSNAFPVRCIKD